MIIDKIYVMEAHMNEDEYLLYASEMSSKVILCEKDPRHARSDKRSNPLKVVAPITMCTDFLWTWYSECLVSEQVKKDIENTDYCGFKFYPVETYTTKGDLFSTYKLYEMVVTGWGGMAKRESGIRVIQECPYCGRSVYSEFTNPQQIFDIDAWDGSDVFFIWPMPKYIMVVEAFKLYIESRHYSGVKFHSFKEFPKTIASGFAPGNISDYLQR